METKSLVCRRCETAKTARSAASSASSVSIPSRKPTSTISVPASMSRRNVAARSTMRA
jgi:hypothetical protein